jgi:glycine betaine/proline transport system substrate-binding protein
MHSIRKNWKRAVMLLAALMLVATISVGCGEEEKPTIKIGDTQFESLWINDAIAIYLIVNGYGYTVETIEMTTPIAQASLAQGDIDIWMEMWEQNWSDNYAEQIAAGTIENLGAIYEGGPQFFMVPQWVADEYNIKTVFDMKDHWELFKDPEDPSKGSFINCIIGWQCEAINDVKMEAYGLSDYYNLIAPGSSGAMEAVLASAQMKQEPIFGYYWAPTAIMGMYDWYILEEPPYDADVWAKITAAKDDDSLRPLSEACAYETLPINIGVNSGLRDTAPDIVEMLENMTVGLEALNKTAAWAKENEVQDWEDAAIWYLNEYESVWKTWVTDDVYDKVKDALAAEG